VSDRDCFVAGRLVGNTRLIGFAISNDVDRMGDGLVGAGLGKADADIP